MLSHAPHMATQDSSETSAVQAPALQDKSEDVSPARDWLAMAQEPLTVVGLVGLCLTVRLLWLERIEIAEDMVFKWHFVRQWFHHHDFSHAAWTHHMTRMGVNVPVFFVQALSGASPRSYYVVQLASFALQVALAYSLGRRLGGRGAGLIAGLMLCLFTGVNRDVSQLLPDGIGGTVALVTYYLLVRYQEASEERRLRWLVAAGAAFFWNYLVKESNLLFLPGFASAVWLCRRNLRDAMLFTALPIAGAVLESAVYRLFTAYGSRLGVVQAADYEVRVTFLGLFDRFTKLEPPWQMVFWMWLGSAFALLPRNDRRIHALLIVPAGFIFFLTFLVRSIDPLLLWTAFRSRYFSAVLPFLVLGFALLAAEAIVKAWAAHVPLPVRTWPGRLRRYQGFAAFALCALIGWLTYLQAKPDLSHHPFEEIEAISRAVNDAYRRNLPIVQEFKPKGLEEARARAAKAAYGVYLNPKYILQSDQAKGGRIPDVLEAVHQHRISGQLHYAYVIRDQRAYKGWKQIRELDEAGCALRLTLDTNRFFTVSPAILPAHCQAPSGQPIPP